MQYLLGIESIARDLDVSPGDTLVFDVQGVPVETVIGSLREVDWERMQTNFFVAFPAGVLEDAPQFHVLMTQIRSAETSAELQRTVVRHFPNVSTIDMALVLETVDAVLDNVTFVIRTMALFSSRRAPRASLQTANAILKHFQIVPNMHELLDLLRSLFGLVW